MLSDMDNKKIKGRILLLTFLMLFLLALGTFVYSNLEKWDIVDSLYFSTVTITTIGYGDLYPTTHASKLFTVFFVLSGVGLMLFILSTIATYYFHYLETHPFVNTQVNKTLNKIHPKKPDEWITVNVRKKKEP